ncbi:MAG: toll/interleukin-1 receptor domain-containing protein [Saprospiraceae bacterium]|jgi:hypothetical protein|nr:toll/interleukin-1 receptor domain-containing protein [Saprospiraceae bacterium]MBK8297562.1 toll/interleukin-1 receptor domain-containing protein [Saprospiraceae bacterium]
MKKIYFSYSDKPEDQTLYKDLNNHLQQYKRKGWIEIYDEQELFKQNGDLTKNEEYLKLSDLTIPLISVDYLNNNECIKILKLADSQHIKIVPILLRECDWTTDDILKKYSSEVLPEEKKSIEHLSKTLPDKQTIFKEIGDEIKCFIFPELQSVKIASTSTSFYWIVAGIVLLIGIFASFFIYDKTHEILLAVLSFLLFGLIALISVKNVLFPTKLSTI